MKLELYHQIIAIIQSDVKHQKRDCLLHLQETFPEFEADTLHSIYSQHAQRKIKSSFRKHHKAEVMLSYYERCMNHIETEQKAGIILQIAEEVDFPPVMIARIILEEHLKKSKYQDSKTVPKGKVSMLLKDTKLINEPRLKCEIELCLEVDELCGPENDTIKRNIGEEYEKKLANLLTEKNIPFVGEKILRMLGYDKTPDYKLEVPIAVDGLIINWIESKASFGDEESHAAYLKDQFWSYTNRFGPGMVIYWFGYIDELDNNRKRGILLCDKLPENIITLELLL